MLGLGKNEAKVYEYLVKYGPCRAGLIINKSDIHRNLVYQSLEKLVAGGFATKVIKKGVWHFQITDPKSLLTTFKRRENILSEVIQEIQAYQQKTDQQIVVYEGLESYRNYWIESLKRVPNGTVNYAVGAPSNKDWVKLMSKAYERYFDLRIKKEIYWKTLHFKITASELQMLRELPDLTEYRLWQQARTLLGNFNVIHRYSYFNCHNRSTTNY